MIVTRDGHFPRIDLGGPDGNAFALIGFARVRANQLGYKKEEIDDIIMDMSSSDYKYLVKVFEFHFGNYCEIVLPHGVNSLEEL